MAEKSEKKVVKLKLDELLRMKDDLETNIKRNEALMRKNNSTPKNEEAQINVNEVKVRYEKELEQLILLKDAIREGNAFRDIDGNTNDHNIYRLSNLNRRRVFLESLNTFEGGRTTLKSNGKTIEFEAKLKYKDVTKELKDIESEIRKLESLLADFNHSTTVSAILYTELELL